MTSSWAAQIFQGIRSTQQEATPDFKAKKLKQKLQNYGCFFTKEAISRYTRCQALIGRFAFVYSHDALPSFIV